MDRETISYEGTCFGQPFSFSENVSDIKALPVSVGDHFDLYHKKKMYNFRLVPDPRAVIKWSMYMDKVTAEKKKIMTAFDRSQTKQTLPACGACS